MRVDLLTKEYPPFIYGGAGVHVNELAKVLRPLADVRVHAFGGPREPGTEGADDGVTGYPEIAELEGANAALRTFGVDLEMAQGTEGTDLVHSHTWYANLAGHLAGLLHGVPHVISAHSLEPLRPWKAEQLGGGYALSSWAEKTAYEGASGIIAVSNGMREDILRSYPAIDPRARQGRPQRHRPRGLEAPAGRGRRRPGSRYPSAPRYRPRPPRRRVRRPHHPPEGAAPPPARLRAAAGRCPGHPVRRRPRHPRDQDRGRGPRGPPAREAHRCGLDRGDAAAPELIAVLAASDVFVCPSVYEPLGIVNLEAMAVGLPVVGSAPVASPTSSSTARQASWSPSIRSRTAPALPSTRPASRPTWPSASPPWSPTPRPPGPWARPPGVASRSTSPGRPLPNAPWTSTTGS